MCGCLSFSACTSCPGRVLAHLCEPAPGTLCGTSLLHLREVHVQPERAVWVLILMVSNWLSVLT